MPMKSQAQRAFMHIHHPGIAKRWEKETPKGKLPQHVGEDQLPGGVGDGHSMQEFDLKEIEAGIYHEMEHTKDPMKALEIAIDHLTEDPHYYSDMKAAGRLFRADESVRRPLKEYFILEVIGPDGEDYVTAVVPKNVSMHGHITDLPGHAKMLGLKLGIKFSSLGAHVTGPRGQVENLLDASAIASQDVTWEDD